LDELRFDGRVAVVTGAGRGIGREHALLLAERGARVVVSDLGCAVDGRGSSEEPAGEVVREIVAQGGVAVASSASVAEPDGAASIIGTALESFGRLDIIINNAGIFAPAPFDQISIEQFRTMLDVHYFGTLLVTRAAWPHLVAARYGRIVNTTSESILGMPLLASYASAKGAIFGLTQTLAQEGAAHGIRANCIAPQAGTRMAAAHGAALSLPESALQRTTGLPTAMNAPVAAFLAHESCPITGEILHVSPGRVSRLAFIQTRGLQQREICADDVAANLDAIMDLSGAEIALPSGRSTSE
jgi:NAD(P)-dependent dehydrogenase (short-subunit alcohol dehydrogenase family)